MISVTIFMQDCEHRLDGYPGYVNFDNHRDFRNHLMNGSFFEIHHQEKGDGDFYTVRCSEVSAFKVEVD